MPQQHGVTGAFAVAGMYTGTYTGGSANLNAVAIQYNVTKNGTLFAAINTADNIITTVWMVATLVLPPLLQRLWPRKTLARVTSPYKEVTEATLHEAVTVPHFALLLGFGLGALLVSQWLSALFPRVPSILVLTTIALVLAQLSFVQRLQGRKLLGYFLVLLFLAVVGAYCDIAALLQSGNLALTLLLWVSIIVGVHALFIFGVGGLLKQDWYLIAIASNANVGGATSATALATGMGRPDLRLPGILVGSVGTALGSYLGIMVAEWLR